MKIHVGGMRPAHARVKMDEVLRYVHETHFSWRGGVEENSVFYYRIQSPAIIIEFDHQAGQAFPQFKEHYRDHIHIIVRTPNRVLLVQIVHGDNIDTSIDEMTAALRSLIVY